MKKQIILYSLLGIILLPTQVFASSNIGGNNRSIPVGQKLRAKIDGVFASNPKLLTIYNKILNTPLQQIQSLPEYHDLLNSQELKILNNSPEMQESLKESIRTVNVQIDGINKEIESIKEQTEELKQEFNAQDSLKPGRLSPKDIRDKINLNDITVSELKKRINSATESLSQQQQLYFTDTSKGVSSMSQLTPVQRPDTSTSDALLVSIANLDHLIDSRIDNMILEASGTASGDETNIEHGLWVKGVKSQAKQAEYKLVPGYKLDQSGIVVGIDFIETPTMLWGVSYSFTADNLKADILSTKEKANSHIASLYGLCEFTDNVFMDVQAKYGKSYIKKSRNNLNLSNDISYAKTRGNIYGGKLEFAYSYNLHKKLNIIPSIGVSYDELQIGAYKEKGQGLNRRVNKRTVSKTSGLLGLKISDHIAVNSYTFIPEMHVKVSHTLDTNNDKTVITIVEGMKPLVTPSGKLPKTIYRIGGSSKIAKLQALELTFGYDYGISKKFHSHSGYVSAKVSF